MGDFDQEPIFWTSTRPGYNKRDRELARFEDGREIVERIPARGHVGTYDNKRPARGVRFWHVVRHDGHIVRAPLTNGAAHLDPNTDFGNYQKAKGRWHGWFTLGACPLALRLTGELRDVHFADKGLLKQTPCPHGAYNEHSLCPHAVAEIKARRWAQKQRTDEINEKFQDPTERQIAANREQMEALGQVVETAITKATGVVKKGVTA